ncbi:MAG: hypothetical protein ACOC9V_06120 [Chloroflexota bacterium]
MNKYLYLTQAMDESDLIVLACNPITDEHVFLDVDPNTLPLRCLCGEHRWEEPGVTARYYPCHEAEEVSAP